MRIRIEMGGRWVRMSGYDCSVLDACPDRRLCVFVAVVQALFGANATGKSLLFRNMNEGKIKVRRHTRTCNSPAR